KNKSKINRMNKTFRILELGLLMAACVTTAVAQGTAFTYQGRLDKAGAPTTGLFDFQFGLYDAPTGGNLLSSEDLDGVPVTNGLFTVTLDFGANAFNGQARW